MSLNKRSWLLRSTLALAFLCITVFFCEVVLRFVLPIPARGANEWAGVPNSTLKLQSEPDAFESTHSFNRLGFRGDDFSVQPQTKMRLVCLGDSWTEGVGAQADEAWPSVVEQHIPKNMEVLNLGDAGSNPDRYLKIFCEVAIPLKPTHAIFCVIPSDFWGGFKIPEDCEPRSELRDMFRERSSSWSSLAVSVLPGWTYLVDRINGKWHPRDGIYWESFEIPVDWFRGDIAAKHGISEEEAAARLDEHMAFIEPNCLDAMKRRRFNGHRVSQELWNRHAAFRCTVHDMGITPEQLEQSVEAWARRISKLCSDEGITPIICFFPESGLVSRLPCGPMIDEYYHDAPDITNDSSLAELVERVCSRMDSKMYFVDVTPELRKHADEQLFLRYDGHPKARAYEIAGKHLGMAVSNICAETRMASSSDSGAPVSR